jgi:hypothetical protein
MGIHVTSAAMVAMNNTAGPPIPMWMIYEDITHPDGTVVKNHFHAFGLDAMEHRAAEYGIHHSQVDLLLEVILYEPWMDWNGVDHTHPMVLWNAPSIAHARDFHLGRLAEAKGRHPLTVAPHPSGDGTDVLEAVRRGSPLHPAVIAAKAHFVAQGRENHRAEQLLKTVELHHTQLPEADRLAHLHRTMNPRHQRYGAVDG